MDKFIKIPEFNDNIISRLTANRLPVELPGVISAAEISAEYGLSSDDIELKWPITVYSHDGGRSDEECDTEGVGSDEAAIFTYINAVRGLQGGRPSPWMLEAESGEGGLAYEDETAGITKGPALPIGESSAYLITPPFIPAVSPSGGGGGGGGGGDEPDPEPDPEPEIPERFNPADLVLSVSFVASGTWTKVTEHEVCLTENPEKALEVLVEVNYNPQDIIQTDPATGESYKSALIDGLYGRLTLYVKSENGGTNTDTKLSGAGSNGLEFDIPFPHKTGYSSSRRGFSYQLPEEINFRKELICAELTVLPVTVSAADVRATAVMTLTCKHETAQDMFDITCVPVDEQGGEASWEIELCNPKSEQSYIDLLYTVTKKKLNAYIQPEDWPASVKAVPDRNNNYQITLEESTWDLNIPEGYNVAAETRITVAYDASAVTAVAEENEEGEEGEEGEGVNASAKINMTASIGYEWYDPEVTGGKSDNEPLELHDTITVACTNKPCLEKTVDSLTATMTVTEPGGALAIESPIKICDDQEGVVTKSFDVHVEINLPIIDDCDTSDLSYINLQFVAIGAEDLGVRLRPDGEFVTGLTADIDLGGWQPEDGPFKVSFPLSVAPGIEKPDNYWRRDLQFKVTATTMTEQDKDEDGYYDILSRDIGISGIGVSCSGVADVKDCVMASKVELDFDEIAGGSFKKSRKICGDNIDAREFSIIPLISFDGVSEEAMCLGNVKVSAGSRLAISSNSSYVNVYFPKGTPSNTIYTEWGAGTPVYDIVGESHAIIVGYNETMSSDNTIENKTATITVHLELAFSYQDAESGETVDVTRTANASITLKCNKDGDDDEDKECPPLDRLKEGVGISISDCNTKGERTIGVDPTDFVNEQGDNIAKASADGGKIVLHNLVSCKQIRDALTAGKLTEISKECSESGVISIGVDEDALTSFIYKVITAMCSDQPYLKVTEASATAGAKFKLNVMECEEDVVSD